MATVTIPSPSAFLDSPVLQPASTPKVTVKASVKKQPSTFKARKKATQGDTATVKPKQTKSRDGCKNCKEKRLKCDETKPACVQCEKKGLVCKGYEKVLKWRPQEEVFMIKTGPGRSKKSCTLSEQSGDHPAGLSPSTAPPLSRGATFCSSLPYSPSPRQPLLSLNPSIPSHIDAFDDGSPQFECAHSVHSYDGIRPMQVVSEGSFQNSTPSLIHSKNEDDNTPQSARTIASHIWSDYSPRSANFILPDTDRDPTSPDYARYQAERFLGTQLPHGLPSMDDFPSYEEDDVEEIVRHQAHGKSWPMPMGSPTSSDSSWSSGGSWSDMFAATVHGRPILHPGSEEVLMMRFDKQTCGILSIKDGPSENPWRTILWPLAREEGALRHAIIALTAFHAAKERPELRIEGMEHMTESLQLLSHGIDSMPLNNALATTLVLAFSESWDMLISTGIRHLQGARNLVGRILSNYKVGSTFPGSEPILGFLCRTWVYMDVIARLTSLHGDDSTDFDIVSTPLCQPFVINHDVDPLMGCASTLFPIIGRVANLVREVRQRSQGNSYQIISHAKALKSQLEKWSAPLVFEAPEDHRTEVEQGLWTAEAYRGATLLYLLQAVPEISYDSVVENIKALAKGVLTNVANVPVTSGMVIIHIFPLLAAGCEAVDQESRTFVRERWQQMMRRMNIQNLDRCLDVAEEVWDRRDSWELENQRRKTRVAASNCLTGFMPATIMKRKHSMNDASASDSSGVAKRRVIQSVGGSSISKPGFMRRESAPSTSGLDHELTVRGRLHWAGVMKDLRWEILVG